MIQRYDAVGMMTLAPSPGGRAVLCADHLEEIKKLREEINDLKKEMQRREDYIAGCLYERDRIDTGESHRG